jgi:hypothetical protein
MEQRISFEGLRWTFLVAFFSFAYLKDFHFTFQWLSIPSLLLCQIARWGTSRGENLFLLVLRSSFFVNVLVEMNFFFTETQLFVFHEANLINVLALRNWITRNLVMTIGWSREKNSINWRVGAMEVGGLQFSNNTRKLKTRVFEEFGLKISRLIRVNLGRERLERSSVEFHLDAERFCVSLVMKSSLCSLREHEALRNRKFFLSCKLWRYQRDGNEHTRLSYRQLWLMRTLVVIIRV